jgi:hypothetical protein
MRIFCEARTRRGAERQAYLDLACEGDFILRAEVESLLAIRSRLGRFLSWPAIGGEKDTFPDPTIPGDVDANPPPPS